METCRMLKIELLHICHIQNAFIKMLYTAVPREAFCVYPQFL